MTKDWISVEDELPDTKDEKDPRLSRIIFDGERVTTTTVHSSYWNKPPNNPDNFELRVTHWMPLPKPPKT